MLCFFQENSENFKTIKLFFFGKGNTKRFWKCLISSIPCHGHTNKSSAMISKTRKNLKLKYLSQYYHVLKSIINTCCNIFHWHEQIQRKTNCSFIFWRVFKLNEIQFEDEVWGETVTNSSNFQFKKTLGIHLIGVI